MHESTMVKQAIENAIAIAHRSGARRIERITFALAPGGHATEATVRTLIPWAAEGTIAEDAEIVFEPYTEHTYDLTAHIALLTAETAELTLVSIQVLE